ncbi:MAG: phytoene/squalene synthase family protein [Actinoallomurus sp.]
MTSWNKALDIAGIREQRLREDYSQQRALVARFRRTAYLAARLLLPAPLVPHVIAATAFMHHSDNVLDEGPRPERAARYAAWEEQVRDGLATDTSEHPVIHPMLHTMAAHPQLRIHLADYLATATADLDFAGFTTEADYQRYVDEYSLPAFMLVAGLLGPDDDQASYRAACRTYIDASQRLDFVNDLAEDLQTGRLTIPEDVLKRHSVTRADLENARDLPGTWALLEYLLGQASRTLDEGRALADLARPAARPLVRALIALDELTIDAASAKGIAVLTGSARPSTPAGVRVLIREYRQARRLR